MINVGILGCKVKPEKFASFINNCADAQVVKLWDLNSEKAENVSRMITKSSGKQCFPVKEADEIISDPQISGVLILSENLFRDELVLRSAIAGKHIFVEKPMCLSTERAEEIRNAVLSRNLKFYMSDPSVSATTIYVKEKLESGILGKRLNATIVKNDYFSTPLKGRDDDPGECADGDVYLDSLINAMKLCGGGLMSDTGIHMLHFANFIFGMPESISSSFKFRDAACEKAGWDDGCDMHLLYEDGFDLHLICSRLVDNPNSYMEINTEHGKIYDIGSLSHGKNKNVMYKMNDKIWIPVSQSEIGPEPLRHVLYWLKMIREDISQEELSKDPMGNCGVCIDKAVEIIKMREMIYH